jgi:hypothetical protein
MTERTFYPPLIESIERHGGAGISEVRYNSELDIVFELLDRRWILGVKLGETIPILKQQILQRQQQLRNSLYTALVVDTKSSLASIPTQPVAYNTEVVVALLQPNVLYVLNHSLSAS